MDVSGAAVLIAALFALSLIGPAVVGGMEDAMRDSFERVSDPQAALSAGGLRDLFMSTLRTLALAVGPIAAVCGIAGIVADLGQVGLRPSGEALKPQPSRINPLSGARNVFGPRMFFEGAKSVVKVAVVGVIVALAIAPKMTELAATVGASPGQLAAELTSLALSISQRAAIAYLVIGAIDFAYQKWYHEKQLRMSKQDVKDEFRSQQLPAEVKSMQRRRMMQQARARMMSAIPDADVVVANPTHFAVALKYDGAKPAPVVVAKGQDLIALQIRRLAAEHDVPVIENKPLARSLHAAVEVGHMIPEDLYHAVAQVLAHVYRIAGDARRRAAAR